MKPIITALVFLVSFSVQAQQQSGEVELKKSVEIFFEGFHKQDSLIIKSVMADKVIMHSLGKDKQGGTVLHQEDFKEFLKNLVSIPSEKEFREVLHSFSVRVDGDMANVWTPYTFYLDGKVSHCGVNSFQLMKVEGQWKIFYLVDTRSREGCDGKEF